MKKSSKKASKNAGLFLIIAVVLVAAAIGCFFLPFVTTSVEALGITTTSHINGIDFVFGADEIKTVIEAGSTTSKQTVPADIGLNVVTLIAAICYVLAIVTIVVRFFANKKFFNLLVFVASLFVAGAVVCVYLSKVGYVNSNDLNGDLYSLGSGVYLSGSCGCLSIAAMALAFKK